MRQRIEREFDILKRRFSDAERTKDFSWVQIPAFPLPSGWNRTETDVAFPIPPAYPGTPPYGIYVPVGLEFNGARPDKYTEPAPTQPPFSGEWGIFSWSPNGAWRSSSEPSKGSNLLNWVLGFARRFREGK